MYKFNYDYFSNVLGMSESSNNYKAQNGIAYGKYQFIQSTFERILDELGVGAVTPAEFLENPSLQETAFRGYVNEIINFITEATDLFEYLGKPIKGRSNGDRKSVV